MQLIIKNGIMADPKSGIYESRNILIRDGLIVDNDLGEHEVEAFEKLTNSSGASEYEVIDATGLHVMPGLIDMHVHFRDPGQTENDKQNEKQRGYTERGKDHAFRHPVFIIEFHRSSFGR